MANQCFFTQIKPSVTGTLFRIYNCFIEEGKVMDEDNGVIQAFIPMTEEKMSNAAKSVHERYVELMRK